MKGNRGSKELSRQVPASARDQKLPGPPKPSKGQPSRPEKEMHTKACTENPHSSKSSLPLDDPLRVSGSKESI